MKTPRLCLLSEVGDDLRETLTLIKHAKLVRFSEATLQFVRAVETWQWKTQKHNNSYFHELIHRCKHN